ncbi:hypothetical protein MYOV003v1_p0040 [Vibrio phage 207E48.1]|nr:hypothetical protein MYOV003v1_p0040 [Vibrio phage 207E48.1]
MAGVMPRTALLLISRADMLVGEYESAQAMAGYFGGLSFDNELGIVKLGGIHQKPHYTTLEENPRNGWSPEAAMADWAKCYLAKRAVDRGCKVYRIVKE